VHRRTKSLLVLATAAAILTTQTAPAFAHEDLLSSSPTENERFAEAPSQIELVFTDEVLTVGAVIVVVDESGKDWAEGDPVIDGATVVVPVAADMPAAGYQVRWRVVSGDGHPISSLIPFTVGDGQPFTQVSTGSPPDSSVEVAGDVSTDAAPLAFWQVLLMGAAGAVLAVSIYVAIVYTRRRAATRASGHHS
jgi:methionine-rich copper-binding protein CopC